MRITDNTPLHLVHGGQSSDRPKNAQAAHADEGAVSVNVRAMSPERSEELSPEIQRTLDDVKAQLRDGSYPIDLDQLAQSIIDDELSRA